MTMLAHSRPLFCRVIGLHAATPDIRIVRLAIISGGSFRFAAGQYARVTFLAQNPRDYSLANSPLEPVLEFHIRHRADGGTGHFVARTLRIGDHAWVEGPFGNAWLRPEHAGPILCIAGGSGLGPMKSIVETALASRPDRRVALYFGGRNERDIYLEDHFQSLARRHPNFRYHVLLSATRPTTVRRRGTVVEGVAADFGVPLSGGASSLEGAKVYMAGPPAMVEAAVAALETLGVPAADIHADPFHAAAPQPAASL
jgi:CDP-4-dehydro-6-deoxyglucose reductase/ferredoxin-NAD(P)+ reductase (naphthalene dioxygenase ferredoxin-specific)